MTFKLPEPAISDHLAYGTEVFTADQMNAAYEKGMEDSIRALKPPDLSHAPGEYHRFDITALACQTAIRELMHTSSIDGSVN